MRKPCLRPDCGGEAYSHGLCRNDYSKARRLVKTGRTTWSELVKAGRANEAKVQQASEGLAWLVEGLDEVRNG